MRNKKLFLHLASALAGAAVIGTTGCAFFGPQDSTLPSVALSPPGGQFVNEVNAYPAGDNGFDMALDGSSLPTPIPLKIPIKSSSTAVLTAGESKDSGGTDRMKAHFVKSKPPKVDRVVLFIIDSMNPDMFSEIPLPTFRWLRERGTHFKEVATPLPVIIQPASEAYPWNCAAPDPALASGTILIGQPDLWDNLIQKRFKGRSAMVMNCSAYNDSQVNPYAHGLTAGYTAVKDLQREAKGDREILFDDDKLIDAAKKIILKDNPKFIWIHLQGPGTRGFEDFNARRCIWNSDSSYYKAMLKADKTLSEFMDWMENNQLKDGTVLMVMGDNGQNEMGWHPPYAYQSDLTTLVMAGSAIKRDTVFSYAEIIDVAPTICFLLGVDAPPQSQGRVLSEAFEGQPKHHPSVRWQKWLNDLLRYHHDLMETEDAHRLASGNPEFAKLNESFATAEKIGSWHKKFNSLPAVALWNEQILKKMRAMLAEKNPGK